MYFPIKGQNISSLRKKCFSSYIVIKTQNQKKIAGKMYVLKGLEVLQVSNLPN